MNTNPNQVNVTSPSPRGGQVPSPGDTADAMTQAANAGAIDVGPETELWKGRTHWMHYFGRTATWILVCIMAGVGAFYFSGEGQPLTVGSAFLVWVLAMLVSGAIIMGKVVLIVLGTGYRLTSQRLFIEKGILSKTVDQTELMRVDDVRLHRSLSDRIFGLGSVAIVSTDATDRAIVIEGIRESEKVAESIRTRMRSLRKKSVFVEQL